MMSITYATVIEQFFKEALEPVLNTYVYDGYTDLASHLREPLGIAIVLFIALLGLGIAQGWLTWSLMSFIRATTKIGLIYSFAMNWSYFSKWVVAGIQTSAGEIGDWLVSSTPIHLPQFAGTGIDGAMQSVFIEITKIGSWVWGMGSWHNVGPYITTLIIWGFDYVMLLFGMFEIVLAKIMLAILFSLAPLFIIFTLFKATYNLFDRWLGLLLSYAILLILVSAVLGLVLSFAQWAISDPFTHHAMGFHLIGFVPAMVVGFIGIGILLKTTQLSLMIGSGVVTWSQQGSFARRLGQSFTHNFSNLNYASHAKVYALSDIRQHGQSLVQNIRQRLRRGE